MCAINPCIFLSRLLQNNNVKWPSSGYFAELELWRLIFIFSFGIDHCKHKWGRGSEAKIPTSVLCLPSPYWCLLWRLGIDHCCYIVSLSRFPDQWQDETIYIYIITSKLKDLERQNVNPFFTRHGRLRWG